MDAQTLRAQAFRALHERQGAFVIPNPWDAGSAKILASLGFEALATTSAGYAFSQGRPDGGLTLDDTLANVRAIVAATDLPVAVDLENGFADDPAECAQSILAAAGAGAVGGSIEDFTGRAQGPSLLFRACRRAHRGRRRDRPQLAFRVYADRPGREFPAWQSGSG